MHTEIIELRGEQVGAAGALLREGLGEYQGVRSVLIDSSDPHRMIVTVEYDDTAAGEFDDSALFILARDLGRTDVAAKFLKAPPWQLSRSCEAEKHAECAGTVQTELWLTSMGCRCECHARVSAPAG